MANRHHGRYGCVLSPHHVKLNTVCVNSIGMRVGMFVTGEDVRQRCLLVIRDNADVKSRELVARAAEIDPHTTLAVLTVLHKPAAYVGPKYLRTALRNHGLNLPEETE